MDEQFLRTKMMLGEDALDSLRKSHVAVFGLGGVGSYCLEILCRSGIGEITLIDQDVISITNINRQILATHSTIGKGKVDVAADRCKDINPSCIIHKITGTYCAENRDTYWSDYDYVCDCIDLVAHKLDLIEQATIRDIPIVSALGTGNKLNPEKLTITDISKTEMCPFARVIRKELRARNIRHLNVVFTPEESLHPEQSETPPPGRRSVPASVPWVPSVAGILMASKVISDIIGGKNEKDSH